MKTQVLYKSRTGNTEKVAKAVFSAIPGSDKDIARLDGQTDYDKADIYFIGFWTDCGTASVEILDYLSSLQGKKIALFGTCGMGGNPAYLKKIEESIRVFIEDDNEYLGAFICQGKMPIQVREKYTKMKNGKNNLQIDTMIHNFDMAMLHPDQKDLNRAKLFVKDIYQKLKKNRERVREGQAAL